MIKEKVVEQIRTTIREHNLIEEGDIVVLGLSGGPDSVCLFHVLKELSAEMDFVLHGAHVNHMFRPGAAEEDQLYVENLCEDSGVCCWTTVTDCQAVADSLGITGEEAGRKVRYDFFSNITQSLVSEGAEQEKVKTAVAHNRNDQVETVLFRLIRGTGTDGLAGMDYIRKDGRGNQIIRPLLDVSREDIEAYCEEQQLEPRTDETNLLPVYGRNRIRLEVIPFLRDGYNPNLEEAVVRTGIIAGEDRDFLWKCADREYAKCLTGADKNEIRFDQKKLAELDSAIRNRVVLKAFGEIGLPADISFVHLKEGAKLIEGGETSDRIDFPKGYAMRISYGNVICERKRTEDHRTGDEKPEMIISCMDADQYERRNGVAAFDLDLLREEMGRNDAERLLDIRRREKGDYIRLPGVSGRKKIQDLFVDMKVPGEIRDDLYMVAIGHEVLFIPPALSGKFRGRYSGNYKISERTKKVITVEINGVL